MKTNLFNVRLLTQQLIQERNIILANTYEYRFPPAPAIRDAATSAAENDDQQDPKMTTTTTEPDTVKLDMTSRLIGLVVVPGQHITRIEVEETPEQARRREAMKR